MNQTLLLDLAGRFAAAPDLAALRGELVRALRDLGVPFIVYGSVAEYRRSGDISDLGKVLTLPGDWTAYYASRQYQDIDPVLQAARRRRRPFHWHELAGGRGGGEITPRQRAVLAEAAAVGMVHGLTVPLFGPGGDHAVLSVASPEPLDGPALHPVVMGALATEFHAIHQDLSQGPAAEPSPPPVSLFPREREVLLWCGRGKTSWEIGRILNIAERTVDHYVEGAMRKLAVSSRIAAVLEATRLGLISP